MSLYTLQMGGYLWYGVRVQIWNFEIGPGGFACAEVAFAKDLEKVVDPGNLVPRKYLVISNIHCRGEEVLLGLLYNIFDVTFSQSQTWKKLWIPGT